MEETAVLLALQQLEDHGLIEGDGKNRVGRREALKQLVTGAALALPTILSVTLPPPAAAASCITLNNNCIFANSTQSNCCLNLRCDNLPPAICRPCFNTGTSFGSGGSIAACNALGTKNLCCNSSGTPILGVGNACLCP